MVPINIFGTLLGMLFAVIATASLKPTSVLAFILIAGWTAAPFIGALIFCRTHKNNQGIGVGIYLSLFIGSIFFFDAVYWHPDAQGGIAFLLLPIISAAVIAGSMIIANKT